MISRIFRYQLEVTDRQEINLPVSVILSVAPARDAYAIDLWAMVMPDSAVYPVGIRIFGTGHPIDDRRITFIGTAVMRNDLVFHVFKELDAVRPE